METNMMAFFNNLSAITNVVCHFFAIIALVITFRIWRLSFLRVFIAAETFVLLHFIVHCWSRFGEGIFPLAWKFQFMSYYILYNGGIVLGIVGLIWCIPYLLKQSDVIASRVDRKH